jgi:shikimate dehydrogenase
MRLALIGKNISHTRSPEIYSRLLGDQLLSFDLLDYEDTSCLPLAAELFLGLDGVSITSPYKQHFMAQVSLVNCPDGIQGVNCLRLLNKKIEATNTDYLGIKELLLEIYLKNPTYSVVILGSGVMAQITELILGEFKIPYTHYSRKNNNNFYQLSFNNSLVINTCSRDYVFKGEIGNNVTFWDYNYNFLPHQNTLPLLCENYIDGFSLLEIQAKYALAFWNNAKSL